ncbi:MAG: hypothetical protein KKE76_13600 [Gammaproteobacteria bacterium]|nr:hypothetical protein [Gammaproteobacteria bacterium]
MRIKPSISIALISIGILSVLAVLLWPTAMPRSANQPPEKQAAPIADTKVDPVAEQDHPDVPAKATQTERLQPEIREQVNALTNTSSEGLVEEVDESGAYSVDLKGRFQSVPVAIIGEDGEVTIQEFSAPVPAE